MSWYQGKKVFITGGSVGIGRATAVQLAREGASVMVAARGQERLDEAVEAMQAAGGEGQVFGSVVVDVTDPVAVEKAAATVLETLKGLDVLICNSGYAQTGITETMGLEHYQKLLDVNYLGHVHTIRAFLPHFIAQGHGDISLVSSLLGGMSTWGYGAYAASKHAIVGFAEALRQEMMLHGVRVTVVYPSTTDTPGLARENQDKHPILWTLEADTSFNAVYTPEYVAKALLRAIQRGRFHNAAGFFTWLILFMYRAFPRVARWMADGELATAAKKVAEGKGASTSPEGSETDEAAAGKE
ncbi:MAG: SDR family NAD(P)-dependent oxidoreductase [Deltaproteobacteria bacterium]|nr:SDR family NAD(P)-dependent oxidoreductase [Deltaproteobacteria bacterium]